jgi:hypothetical protein
MPSAITGSAAFCAANAAKANVSNAAITTATMRIITSSNFPLSFERY